MLSGVPKHPFPPAINYEKSRRLEIVQGDDPEISYIMAAGGGSSPRSRNRTPTARDLAAETPYEEREAEGGDTKFYEEVNDTIQGNRLFERRGMLTVNYDNPSSRQVNHCIFYRQIDDGEKIRIYIYDPNDERRIKPVNYMPAFSPRLASGPGMRPASIWPDLSRVEFFHPFHSIRNVALNMDYGQGVCEAVSYSLSRLWDVVEKRRKGEDPIARFQRTRQKFENLLSSRKVTAKVLIRLAMGKNYREIADVVRGVSRPPVMEHAYKNLKEYISGKKESDADVGRKRLYTEMENGTLLVHDEEDEVEEDELPMFIGAGAGAGAGAGGTGYGMVYS